MADYVVQESDGISKFLLEDGSGALLLELQGGVAFTQLVDLHYLTGFSREQYSGSNIRVG